MGVERLVSEASVTKATFYRHFPAKGARQPAGQGDQVRCRLCTRFMSPEVVRFRGPSVDRCRRVVRVSVSVPVCPSSRARRRPRRAGAVLMCRHRPV
ncbi:hypothetical protein [Streptomyces sp. NPDC057002]|uniref:hypothetical protein n=1 Tax=Streptomyces sp. NPDC057002 TaxID=3345992 RepID=UPI00362693B1